ncbi:MAG: thymidine phosphorylase [Clostridia bacterium]|nr:thymidine phosphorylase [Clostridia bacterium]
MDIKTIIRKKRSRQELTRDEIRYFIGKLSKGEIEESQAAAVLSYIYINGMTEREILELSIAMAETGDMIDLSGVSDKIVDKHSTGGIGDKATILLMPILAALDIPVAKISTRGYGISGSTIDKLESIPGFNTNLSGKEFVANIKKTGACIMNQSAEFAPAESIIYRLRNEVACENSLPLIAACLMSLKIATGSQKIVFDITCGSGTYISTKEEAKKLSRLLVKLGRQLNKDVACVITSMNQPLGNSIGYNIEMKETINALKGIISDDLGSVVEALGSVMIGLATGEENYGENDKLIKEVIKSGAALEKFKEMVAAQGGNTKYIDNPELFKKSKFVMPVLSTESGTVEAIDADMVGSIAYYLGAGRMKDEEDISRTAGIILNKKIGESVTVGETLAYVHTDEEDKLNGTTQNLAQAYSITTKKINFKSRILEIIK